MVSADPSDCRQELVERLDILRRSQSFCDVKVLVKDKELTAHKAVLAAASPFFLSLLTSDMRESKEHLIRIELEEATAAVMEDALQYIYTGNVSVTEENAHNLMAIADYLLLPGLKTVVGRYLTQILTIENCVFSYYFADKYHCMHLKEKAHEMINSNFCAVMERDDFLSLDVKQVMEWVSSDDITVNTEEEVFRGIVKWVSHLRSEREVEFPALLHQVRLVSISHDFLLNKLAKEELVVKNADVCLNFVLEGMRLVTSVTDEQVGQKPRKCLERHIAAIFVCGGRRSLSYFPKENVWYKLSKKPFQHKHRSNPCQCRGKIYMSSHDISGLDFFQLLEFYAPAKNSWGAFQAATTFTSTVVLKGCLYGTEETLEGNEIHRYNPEKDCFHKLKKPDTDLFGSCFVTDHEKYIYLVGGRSNYIGGVSSSTTYRFDPSADDHEWEEIAPINQARCNSFGAAMNGKVYIAGGHQDQAVALGTCEVYNPLTNEWQLMPSLMVPRISASMVCCEGTLYVLGGVPSPGKLSQYYQLKHLMQSKMNGERNHLYQLIALKQVRKRSRRINLKLVLQDFAKK